MICILEMQKLRIREVQKLAQVHTASKWQVWDSNPAKSTFLTTYFIREPLQRSGTQMGCEDRRLGRAGQKKVRENSPCGGSLYNAPTPKGRNQSEAVIHSLVRISA